MDANNNVNSESSVGPVVATIIILAIVVLGGLYFWGQRNSAVNTDIYSIPISPSEDTTADTSAIDAQSNSDTSNSINADLNSTNLDNLETEINAS